LTTRPWWWMPTKPSPRLSPSWTQNSAPAGWGTDATPLPAPPRPGLQPVVGQANTPQRRLGVVGMEAWMVGKQPRHQGKGTQLSTPPRKFLQRARRNAALLQVSPPPTHTRTRTRARAHAHTPTHPHPPFPPHACTQERIWLLVLSYLAVGLQWCHSV